jgi:virulence factor Mce-like protein
MALRRSKDDAPRVSRKDRRGRDPFRVGVLTVIGILVLSYVGFTKWNPFAQPFTFKAEFPSANSIRIKSPVRIAGVNVGSVTRVEGVKGTTNALVTMEVKKDALPIHKDARLKIRPRIFLEGNFFVDMRPGTPSSPTIADGDTIKVSQTATPVQIDQVFTSLQRDTRKDLQRTLQELGSSLTAKPTAAQDADQSPVVRGMSAAQALNDAITYGEPALRSSAIQQQALLGTEPDDLKNLVRGLGGIGAQLHSQQDELISLVENFNTTMGAFASESSALQSTVQKLGPTLQNTYTALGNANAAFPNIRRFTIALIPGVEQTQPTIDAVTPWIPQARALVSEPELGGLVKDLQPAVADLASVTETNISLLQQGDLLAKCFSKVILPSGDVKLNDGQFSTGKENYKEFWYSVVGLSSEGQNFDGNGEYVRFQTGGGQYPMELRGGTLGKETDGTKIVFHGNSIGKPLYTKPAWTSKPPYNFKAECYKQAIPDFAATPTGPSDAAPTP